MPTLLIHDTSPAFGGSLTSIQALLPVLRDAGWRVHVAMTQPHVCDRFLGGLSHEARQDVGVTYLPDPFARHIHGLGYGARELARVHQLERLISACTPDAILGNNTPQGNAASAWVACARDIPYFQYVRGPFHRSSLAKELLALAREVFVVGNDPSLRPLGRPGLHIPEGLSSWPSLRRHDARSWLWCGSSMAWKGLPLMLSAFDALPASKPTLHVCRLPFREDIPGATPAPDVWPQHVVPHIDPPDIDEIRRRCSVYIHTSLRPEPFGRTILEAMAAGLCAIVPDEGQARDLITHEVHGLWYEPRDPKSLLEALRRARNEPELVRACGARAQARALEIGPAVRAFRPLVRALQESVSV